MGFPPSITYAAGFGRLLHQDLALANRFDSETTKSVAAKYIGNVGIFGVFSEVRKRFLSALNSGIFFLSFSFFFFV